VDVGDPHQHVEKHFMQKCLKLSDEDMVALPPQLFKEQNYRGVCLPSIVLYWDNPHGFSLLMYFGVGLLDIKNHCVNYL
jgi:hypothetical protein